MQCGAKTYKYTRLNWLASRMLLQQKNRTLLEKKKKSYGITNVNMFDFEPQTNFRSCFQKSSSSNHDPSGKEINLVCLSRPPQSVAINISNYFDLQSIDQTGRGKHNSGAGFHLILRNCRHQVIRAAVRILPLGGDTRKGLLLRQRSRESKKNL